MEITIAIKALNEERYIAQALESALSALEGVKQIFPSIMGRVVLADSGSTDRTVEIGKTFPVLVVQFSNVAERCCGAGAQLAYQHASGDYFYLMDGDMRLEAGFLVEAIQFLEDNPRFAAVGGLVNERVTVSEEFQIRAGEGKHRHLSAGEVDRLDGGGLYRVKAIQEAGFFFADRNLHAFEEFELSARLQSHGWKLMRLSTLAVDHFGHSTNGYTLLWRRLKSGYAGGVGEILRASLGKAHFMFVIKRLSHLRHSAAVIVWWIAVAIISFLNIYAAAFVITLPLVFLSYRRGSFWLGTFSVASWNIAAVGLLSGFFAKRVDPARRIDSVILSDRVGDMYGADF